MSLLATEREPAVRRGSRPICVYLKFLTTEIIEDTEEKKGKKDISTPFSL
jgi:hypothetical protein